MYNMRTSRCWNTGPTPLPATRGQVSALKHTCLTPSLTLSPKIQTTSVLQAYFTLLDPWANSFARHWRKALTLGRFERLIGRGGWVASRNFELDSGAYFMNFLWNYFTSGEPIQELQYC